MILHTFYRIRIVSGLHEKFYDFTAVVAQSEAIYMILICAYSPRNRKDRKMYKINLEHLSDVFTAPFRLLNYLDQCSDNKSKYLITFNNLNIFYIYLIIFQQNDITFICLNTIFLDGGSRSDHSSITRFFR